VVKTWSGVAAGVMALGLTVARPAAITQDDAGAALAAVTAAVGASNRPVRAFRLFGRYWTSQSVSYRADGAHVEDREAELEIDVLRPDHYLRTETYEAGRGAMSWWRGVSAGRALSGTAGVGGQNPTPARSLSHDFVTSLSQDASKLLLGFAGWTGDFGLRATAIHDGVIEVRGRDGFTASLVVSPTTRVPERVVTKERIKVYEPGLFIKSGPGGPSGGVTRYDGPPVEVTTSFEDRRMVDGLRLPYRVRVSASGVVLSEIRIDRFEVNPPLTTSDFTRWLARDK
jgi:hypothetical protein